MPSFLNKLTLALALLLFSPRYVIADSNYSTSFTSTYTVNTTSTLVKHQIALTNRTKHLYPREYVLQLGTVNIDNLRVTQDDAPVDYQLQSAAENTTVTISPLAPVVGLDQTTILHVEYQTSDIAESLERTWSVNIPRLIRANEIDEFVRIVRIPSELGLPSIQFPSATSISSTENNEMTILTYNGFPNNSLSLLFGDSEFYRLVLTYHLHNPTLSSADTELALPPETGYQKVIIENLDPPPRNIRTDEDGNWLAVYPLKSKENLSVTAEVYLEVFASPQGTSELAEPSRYTKSQPYWDFESGSVTGLADQLSSPESIYDYLVANFTYDHSRAYQEFTRLGASEALEHPNSAICTEFADSFVALSRAKQIPSRVVNGYAYSTNPTLRPLGLEKDVLHAWVEYYDQDRRTWIQLDPTWGNTTGGIDYFHKLDFNHLTFVRQGIESDYPYPAGSYKDDPNQKTVMVELVKTLPERRPQLETTTENDSTIIRNSGNVAAYDKRVGYLPPYASATVSHSFLSGSDLVPRILPLAVFALLALLILIFVKKFKSH